MTPEQLDILKDNTYYDQTGKQILIGDLLKVFHFIGPGRKKNYMYFTVVMEGIEGSEKDFPVMACQIHYSDKPHVRMYVCANKQTRVYETAKIIGEKDWESKRKRIKLVQ